MKKFLTAIFIICLAVPAFSQKSGSSNITDNAGILNAGQIAGLSQIIESAAAMYEFDLVIVTEKNIGNKAPSGFADDFYDYGGYGFRSTNDGCLLLLVTETRDYALSATGRGIKLLNSMAEKKLADGFLAYLKNDNYYQAFMAYLTDWELFLGLEAKGRSYNFFMHYNIPSLIVVWFISIICGLSIVLAWKRKMNTAIAPVHAAAYIINGSLNFREKKDRFLYSVVTKTKRESGGSSSGGARTGSSGTSHSGRSGKY